MTVSGLMHTLRKQEYWRELHAVLNEFDISDYDIAQGRSRHPILSFTYEGRRLRLPLPTSPSAGGAAARYVPRNLRALIAGAKVGHAPKV